MTEVPRALIEAAGRFLGAAVRETVLSTAPFSVRPVLRLFLDDGRTVILKTGAPIPASSDPSFRWADLVERETWMYERAGIAPTIRPQLLGAVEAAGWRGLLLEDLTGFTMPPPWTPHAIDSCARALAILHRSAPPAFIPDDWHGRDRPQPYFDRIAARRRAQGDLPATCTAEWWDWFERARPQLEAAYLALFGPGRKTLVHNNVRSDNLFLRRGETVLIDWDHAILGTPAYDSVYWALGVEREGGGPASAAHARYEAIAGPVSPDDVFGVLAFWTGYFVDHLQAARSRPVNQQLRGEYLRLVLRWLAEMSPLPPQPVAL
ncbi:MAG: aminoglycoside phosphotransferase family protein [Chloroflexota bacterium]|nr:aminoglycoside phosphotransferase family protein [Dehalococcoidia bacterium]MDW8253817.1 aminoglycoside phosphotransferase family protein [Chloroflexota bacterium]